MSYDFIFAGAGPAGLTGAICAARQGRRCLLIEKKPSLDLHPRGETLRFRPILDEILGEGVMASLVIADSPFLEYYAPEPEKVEKIALTMKVTNLTFHWAAFMQAFEKQINSLGIDLVMGAEVVDIIETSGVVTGVVYKDANGIDQSINAGVVFACDGHKSVIGQKAGVDYTSLNYPIVKSLFKNAAFDNPGFKFFIMPAGGLDFAPEFPPAIMFLFPRDGKNCEAGIMVMAKAGAMLGCKMPTEDELLKVWQQAVKQYPVLCDMLKQATVELQEATMIPMKGPMNEVIPRKGVVLLGDAAGFVEIQGGSGLVSSMESAKFWVNTIIEEQNQKDASNTLWEDENIRKMTKAYTSSGIFQHNKKNAEWSNANWETMFVGLRTSEEIIKNWEMIKSVMDIF